MAQNIRPLSEVVSTILPDRWAETPQERAKQLSKVQRYLATESHFPEGIPEEEEFNVSFQRGLLMGDIQSYYGSPGLFTGIKNWFINNIFDPIKDFISGALNTWPFTVIGDIWSSIQDVVGWFADFAGWLWDKGISSFQAFLDAMWDFFTDPLGTIQSALEGIWNTLVSTGSVLWDVVVDAAKGAVNYIWSGIKNTLGGAWDAIKNFGESVWNAAKGALNAVIDPIWGILDGIKNFFAGIWNAMKNVAGFLGELPHKIWNGLTTLADWIKKIPGKIWEGLQTVGNWIKQIPGKIWEGMKQLGKWIYQGVRAALSWITENVVPTIRGFINTAWNAMKAGVAWIATKIFDTLHWIWDAAANFGHILASGITSVFKKVLTASAPIFSNFADWTLRNMVIGPMKAMRGEGSPDWWHDIINTVEDTGEHLMKTILDYVMPEEGAVTFDKANEAAGRFLNIGLFFGMADSMVTMGEEIGNKLTGAASSLSFDFLRKGQGYGEAIIPTQQFPPIGSPETAQEFGGIAKFFKSIYYSLGLGFMMWTIWSGSLRAVMGAPREEYYRRVYKTKYPMASTFKKAFSNQMTLPNSNESWLDTAGYSPMYRDMIKQLSWDRLSRSQIEDWYKKGHIEAGELWDYVKWLGYQPKVANWIVEDIKQEQVKDRMDDMADAYEEAYEVGTVNHDTALSKLKSYGYPERRAKYTLKSIDTERTADFREDVVDELVDLLEDGEITEEKFRREASKFIVQPHLVQRYVMLAAIERGDIGQIGTVGSIDQRIGQLEHRIDNLSKQIDRLVDERSEQREVYQHRIETLKGEIGKENEITDPEAKAEIEKLREKAEEKDRWYGEQIQELREEKEELQLDLEAMEGYKVAG